MDIVLPLLVISFILCIVSGVTFIISLPLLENEPFVLANISNPAGFIFLSISIIVMVLGASIVYNFLIPVFIISFVLGYLLSIKYLPKFVLSQSKKIQKKIGSSATFPYYATILLTAFWPLIMLCHGINSIFKLIDIRIETPKKSVHRALNSDKGQ